MTFNSRLALTEFAGLFRPLYLTSEVREDDWGGQLPISRQNLVYEIESLIDGIYATMKRPEVVLVLEPDLELEFQAWESASDEALTNFEKQLD